jgi:uncharacterized protein DUF4193
VAKDPEDLEEIEEEDEDVDEDDVDVAEEEAALPAAGDDDAEEEASLDELLAQRAAGKKGAAEETEDENDIMALTSEPQVVPSIDVLTGKVIPIKDRQEFVCNSCHLVKARSQLADADRGLCRDCV